MVSEGWVLFPKRPPTCGTKTRNGGFLGVDPRCHVVVGVVDETWRPGLWADGESGRDLALSVDCAVPAEMGRRARPAEREAPSLIVIQALFMATLTCGCCTSPGFRARECGIQSRERR